MESEVVEGGLGNDKTGSAERMLPPHGQALPAVPKAPNGAIRDDVQRIQKPIRSQGSHAQLNAAYQGVVPSTESTASPIKGCWSIVAPRHGSSVDSPLHSLAPVSAAYGGKPGLIGATGLHDAKRKWRPRGTAVVRREAWRWGGGSGRSSAPHHTQPGEAEAQNGEGCRF